jgi:hypothetical protein
MARQLRFEFVTEEGVITVDPDEELGDLSPPEFRLLSEYVYVKTVVDEELEPERARAGGVILVLLSRKVSMSPTELLRRVI